MSIMFLQSVIFSRVCLFWGHFMHVQRCILTSCLLCLGGGFWRVLQLLPVTRAVSRTPIGHPGQQRGPADAAIWVFLLVFGVQFSAAGEAVHKILQEVAAEDHVNPRVAAAVETGKECRQSHCCVLRIWGTETERKEGRGVINLQNIWCGQRLQKWLFNAVKLLLKVWGFVEIKVENKMCLCTL